MKILKTVLAKDERADEGTNHYTDDITVNENVVTAGEVITHLRKYGLDAKPPRRVEWRSGAGFILDREC